MTNTPEQIVAANKANVETLLALANTAFASADAQPAQADPAACEPQRAPG